jgi:hypothetical protein
MIHKQKVILLIIILIFVHSFAFAQNARLAGFFITYAKEDLLVSMNVKSAFREKIKKAVLSGAPASFSFIISLHHDRNFWFDEKIAEFEITHTIKYNSLKKKFVIKRPWKENLPLVTESFEEAQKLMTEIHGLNIIPLQNLEHGKLYRVKAKAELSRLTLPFYLHYIFFFVSLWDFETDWYTLDFIY